ncbi:phage infection protein [Lacticaseibacillus paracasei]|nr:phage infection protein [Lacticaseibacillus paracasei]
MKQELTDANALLNGHMNLITSGITTVADLYQNDFPSLKTKLTKATNFINQDLPGVESDLTSTLALANEKCRNYKAGWMMHKP